MAPSATRMRLWSASLNSAARDWGAGTMTKSGYPFVVKLWQRGQSLDQAKEVFRGTENDIGVQPETLNDGQGHHAAFMHVEVRSQAHMSSRRWSSPKPVGAVARAD